MADDPPEKALEGVLVLVLVLALAPSILNMIWEIEAVRQFVRELLLTVGLTLAIVILVYVFFIRSEGGR